MKDFPQRFLKFKKHLLTLLLTSNLVLVSTGSAVVDLSPSPTPTPQVATSSSNNVDAPPSVTPGIPSTSSNNPKLKKIDPTGKFIEDEIVIRYKENVQDNEKNSIASENETQINKDLPHSGLKILSVDPAKREKAMEALKNNPSVEYVGPNFATGVLSMSIPTPNDPTYPQQWHLSKINAPNVWSQRTGSSSVKIAEVDTGINYNLAEFGLVENGGRVIKGRDAVNMDDDPMDDNGHGTMVAGVMGAKTYNGVDVAAVDWHAQIIAVKVLASNGSGGSAELAEGLKWLVDSNPVGLKIVNLSMWVGDDDPNVRSYIATLVNRGILVVVGSYNSSPGNWNCDALPLAKYPGVVAVVATDETDTHWSGCTQGIQDHLIAAPGHNIWTEYALGGAISVSGTSFAAPQVAGAASILFSCPNNPTAASVRYSLLTSATALGAPGFDAYGWGRLDMWRAINKNPSPCDTDGDGYTDYLETYIGTNPTVKCGGPDAWPPDINGDKIANTQDVIKYIPVLNSFDGDGRYNRRFDLNADGRVNTQDVIKYIPILNARCSL